LRPIIPFSLFVLVLAFVPSQVQAQSKADEKRILAAELKAIRTACVVPPELPDGSQSYTDAGELAKILRDYLNWEASVCTVEYHAGHTFRGDMDKYDAYLRLSRNENGSGASAIWQSRSVTVILTPVKLPTIPTLSKYQPVDGRWGYTNNLLNPNEMIGLAKKIKKSMQQE